jgi:hypothetical protein
MEKDLEPINFKNQYFFDKLDKITIPMLNITKQHYVG